MAKSEVFEGDQSVAVAKVTTELKKELHRLVKAIIEDSSSEDENGFGCIDRANQTLQALKELKEGGGKQRSSSIKRLNDNNRNNNESSTSVWASCPQEFRCPLSKELMRDPVILSTGQVVFLFNFSLPLVSCVCYFHFFCEYVDEFLPWTC